ncbi:SDR family oxidoreductase [Corynebacterium hansenii]|uniref:SDR family oxidoreductase n=1 Tax=Corynebacterium hansenii TaxID=394964 RepID=A0ABV7ZK36_9CORY|nr:SDR family oxidoreductase [Corynebacterium hansenii]WJY99242.1 3-oxoacyl-[acyl-carrier-protein] reductase FabG [Corynebacterium hansenii]
MVTHDFKGKVALVTGGTRGIGNATARMLAEAGAKVAITSRKADAAEAAAADLARATGGTVIGLAAHAGEPGAADDACARVRSELGGIDVLVNNAGTNPAYGPVIEQERSALEKTFAINALAPMNWIRAAVAHGLGERPGAAVVNVASIGAWTVEDGLGAYNASKAALLHVTRQLSRELGPAVRVNSVSPGVVRTKLAEALWREHEAAVAGMTPLGRIGEPDDVADVICFLAGDGARWMTGSDIVVDGGQLVGTALM